jgi:hypothetical protein
LCSNAGIQSEKFDKPSLGRHEPWTADEDWGGIRFRKSPPGEIAGGKREGRYGFDLAQDPGTTRGAQ